MKLKCIGGPCDGKVQDIANYYREHDQIQIMGTIEFDLSSFEEDLQAYREGKLPDCILYHYYKIVYVYFSKTSTLKFLTPMNWTREDAIRHAMGCADG